MKIANSCVCLFTCITGLMMAGPVSSGGDHHMHIRSENASAVWTALCESMPEACGPLAELHAPSTAVDVIRVLDEAKLSRGVIMSLAYLYGFPELADSSFNDEAFVRAENEYVASQVAVFPSRLVGFFSVNPLAGYAIEEIRYWAEKGGLAGLKLHLANSDLDFKNPEHIARLRVVFDILNEYKLPVAIHLRNRNPEYGHEDAAIFIDQVARHAPHVTLHVAHLAGWGGFDAATDGAIRAFLEAMERGELDRSNVWFDLAAVVMPQLPDEAYLSLPDRLRQIGLDRILFATDWDAMEDPGPHRETLKQRLPMSDSEWEQIFNNEGPYLH